MSIPMPSIELFWIVARALLLVLAFAGFAWAFSRWRKAAERDTQRIFEQLDLILGELREVSAQIQTPGANGAQPAEATHTAARFAIPTAASPRGYEVAVRLAKNGASREELMSNCGISRHEAELLLRLHGAKRNDAEPQKQMDTKQADTNKNEAPPRARLSVVG